MSPDFQPDKNKLKANVNKVTERSAAALITAHHTSIHTPRPPAGSGGSFIHLDINEQKNSASKVRSVRRAPSL